MSYLLDTNVLSELRKRQKADVRVRQWLERVADEDLFLSVLVIGELRRGIERVRHRQPAGATRLESWLTRLVTAHGERILPVTTDVAHAWGRLNVPDPLPVIDSLLVATAHVHGLTVVTRNTRDMARTGVPVLNPFEGD